MRARWRVKSRRTSTASSRRGTGWSIARARNDVPTTRFGNTFWRCAHSTSERRIFKTCWRRVFEGRSRKGQPFLASVVGHFVATRLCSPYIHHEDDNNDNDGDAAIPGCEPDQKFRAVVFLFQLGLGCDQRGKGCVALAFIKTDR